MIRRVPRRLKARLSWTATIGLTIVWVVLWGDVQWDVAGNGSLLRSDGSLPGLHVALIIVDLA